MTWGANDQKSIRSIDATPHLMPADAERKDPSKLIALNLIIDH
jgi:hypothetical protein